MAREGSLRLFCEAHNPLHNQTASAPLNQEGYRP